MERSNQHENNHVIHFENYPRGSARDYRIRQEERSYTIWRLLDKMERHQAEQNGYIRENLIVGKANSTWILVFRWAIGGIIAGIGILFSKLQGLW
ncbi:hypothetical protein LCGC14_1747890 [marine sediment metagenome]|uniref:Uncharacterized protein n=1 Tax=marine sediment metagenome TaxID=412755 RepID=A0A0F9H4Q8_9ZZZZ